MSRTLLVGGLSSLHDPLCVAALRGAGVDAVALPLPTDAGLAKARALGNHGQCNPAQYSVGAVLEHAARSGLSPREFGARHAWVAPGSCGPCRLAAFPLEWARVLEGAGLGALHVELFDQHAFGAALVGGDAARSPGRALLAALVTGDVLATLGHRLRPWVEAPAALDALLDAAVRELAAALEGGGGLRAGLRAVGARAHALATQGGRVLPRVLLVGEPWVTLNDGDPSAAIARRLEELGAEVDAPKLVDWLRTLAWQRARSALTPEPQRREATRAVPHLGALWRLLSSAAGVFEPLDDPQTLGALAEPWYPADVRGGSAHLEVARALEATQRRAVHLVVSVKPFGCLPSTSLSDGVLAPLLRRMADAPAFLALETTGDGYAAIDSRLEMALHGATLRALRELEIACDTNSLSPAAARRALASRRPVHLVGPRRYACTAAESIARGVLGDASEAGFEAADVGRRGAGARASGADEIDGGSPHRQAGA